jgi:hypothetical protein
MPFIARKNWRVRLVSPENCILILSSHKKRSEVLPKSRDREGSLARPAGMANSSSLAGRSGERRSLWAPLPILTLKEGSSIRFIFKSLIP